MRIEKIYPVIIIFTIIMGFGCYVNAGELVNPQLGATYTKFSDGTKSISLSLSARVNDKRVNIENSPISVYAVNESEKTLLGTVNTNWKGKAVLNVKPDVILPKDKEGYFTFDMQYAGNSNVNKKSVSIHIRDVFMSMSFIEKDSIKTVKVKVHAFDEKGVKGAVREIPVEFYVKRLFCLYRFGGEKTDSSGLCTAEFPVNMPGDTTGTVIVFAKILENDTYGTVETVQNFSGGKQLIIEPKPKRGLGDTDAPLWMVYTLLVLLSGVWLHVIYVISLVVRINIVGKKAAKQSQTV
ncbi:MAG: hypothetical protein WCP32_12570 [Bacteroidota bacterium]